MKKIVCILLLFIIIFQTGGILLLFKTQQWYIRREVKLALNNNKTLFEKLTLTLSEFHASKVNEKEIKYHGNMYDIKSLSIKGSEVELIVINDLKEKSIINRMTNFIKHSNDSKSNFPTKLFKFLQLNYLVNSSNIHFKIFDKCLKFLYDSPFALISPVKDIQTPPPRLV